MRIVCVDASTGLRGGQQQLLLLARGFAEARAELGMSHSEMLVVVRPDAPLYAALIREGIAVQTVPFRGGFWGTRALGQIATHFGATGIAAHDRHAVVHISRLGWPWVAHRRVDFVPGPMGAARYRRAEGVIAVSSAVASVMRNVGVERTAVVHDGVAPCLPEPPDRINVRRELGLPESALLLLAAGALVAHKGHRVLIDALPLLPGWHAAIAGTGPLAHALRARADEQGVSNRLHLLGRREDLTRWFASADVFVHPSLEEGLGQVLIEAARSGIPMVVSQAGGIGEIGVGIPVAPGDVRGLARAVQYARQLPRVPDSLPRFDVRQMVRETLTTYARFGLGAR